MSAIQFNLIPDSKLNQVKLTKKQNLLLRVLLLTAVSLAGIFILLLFTAEVVQKKQLSDAKKNITAAKSELDAIPNLNQMLTVQNQLKELPSLHSAKHITSRISGYLKVLTPADVHIGNLSLDLATNLVVINGTAKSAHSVNVFVDTLKYTKYTVGSQAAKPAFNSITENSFSLSNGTGTYQLTAGFDPLLFSNSLVDSSGGKTSLQLVVPNITTTHSVIDDPSNTLFNGIYKRR